MSSGRLLAQSCTTGWFDWVHGELWLTDVALVRRRLGWATSTTHTLRSSVPEPVVVDLPLSRPAHRTDKDLPLSGVAQARLHRGRLSDRLRVEMHDGSTHTLMWLSSEPATRVLEAELPGLLGARFALD